MKRRMKQKFRVGQIRNFCFALFSESHYIYLLTIRKQQLIESQIIEAIRLLYSNRRTIDFLFSKRPSGKGRFELLDYDNDLTEERIGKLLEKRFVEEKDGEISLNMQLISFFEDYLGIGDANVEMLNADLKNLERNLQYYEDSNQNIKHLIKIREILKKLDSGIRINIVKLYASVDEVYKTERDLKVKLSKLENYRKDRDEVLLTIEATSRFLELNKVVLKNESEVMKTRKQLRFNLIEYNRQLLTLQNQVVDYIHKVQLQTQFYKKLTWLKTIKNSGGMLNGANSNIYEVVSQNHSLLFQKTVSHKWKVPLEAIADNENGQRMIERIRERLKMKSEREHKKESLDSISETQTQESLELPTDELFSIFSKTKTNLFDFYKLTNFQKPIPKSTPKKESLFLWK